VTLVVCGLAGGGKLMAVGSLAASATVIVYQLSFALVDYVNEIYGAAFARGFVRHGFIALSVALACFVLVVLLPPAHGFDDSAYTHVFGVTPRIAGAGLIAFIIAQLENVWIYDIVRRRRPGSGIAVRSALATAVAQFVDTVIFVSVAFAGVVDDLPRLLFGQYAVKLVLVALCTPLLSAVARWQRATVPAAP
jgi:uncharacterized integral membrane protein (TIGR00697 family)